jgi:hypothetical protein
MRKPARKKLGKLNEKDFKSIDISNSSSIIIDKNETSENENIYKSTKETSSLNEVSMSTEEDTSKKKTKKRREIMDENSNVSLTCEENFQLNNDFIVLSLSPDTNILDKKLIFEDDKKNGTVNQINIDKLYNTINQMIDSTDEFSNLKNKIKNYFGNIQKIINPQMRTILLNWIIEVTSQLGFKRQTYHQTVFLVDNFLIKYEDVKIEELQLVGVVCLMISAKFEVY